MLVEGRNQEGETVAYWVPDASKTPRPLKGDRYMMGPGHTGIKSDHPRLAGFILLGTGSRKPDEPMDFTEGTIVRVVWMQGPGEASKAVRYILVEGTNRKGGKSAYYIVDESVAAHAGEIYRIPVECAAIKEDSSALDDYVVVRSE